MLRTDRIAVWIFFLIFILLVPSIQFLNYIDELAAVLMLCLAGVDSIVNRAWRRYRMLWILLGVMCFYAVYSMTAVNYNAKSAIVIDILIESKPFIMLFVMMAIRPRFTRADRQALRVIAIVNVALCTIILLMPRTVMWALIQHISYGGIYIMLSCLVFVYCSIDERGQLSRINLLLVLLFATCGLLCGRSKYYGEYVLLWFFLTLYSPGMLRRITARQILIIGGVAGLVAIVAWQKINYYFLVGNSGADTFDPETIESFARPVLYATGFLILLDHFPFGSGLASFASYRSAEPYSGVYAEYGIDTVWGLSPSKPDFICDAYYPSLAQFGIAGFILFFWMWVYVIRLLGSLTRLDPQHNRFIFATGMMCVLFVLIESTSGTCMVNSGGVMDMAILGIIAGQACDARECLRTQSLTHSA